LKNKKRKSQVSEPNMQFYTVSAPCQLMCTIRLVQGCKPKNLHLQGGISKFSFDRGKPKVSQMTEGKSLLTLFYNIIFQYVFFLSFNLI